MKIMKKQIAAANWKMNLTLQQGTQLLDDILAKTHPLSEHQQAVFAVPFPYLQMAQRIIAGRKNVFVAAQNCYSRKSGAFTGEVSAEMLRSIGVQFVIIGHSERREYFQESHQMLAEKIDRALENEITPIFCCGESLAVREENNQDAFVGWQLEESLFHLSAQQVQKVVIAYEPIWAIGTGKTASSEQAQEIHASIRSRLVSKYDEQVAAEIPLLYGGSVKASNAGDLFSRPDVDGGLVGGASLVADEFTAIIQALK